MSIKLLTSTSHQKNPTFTHHLECSQTQFFSIQTFSTLNKARFHFLIPSKITYFFRSSLQKKVLPTYTRASRVVCLPTFPDELQFMRRCERVSAKFGFILRLRRYWKCPNLGPHRIWTIDGHPKSKNLKSKTAVIWLVKSENSVSIFSANDHPVIYA